MGREGASASIRRAFCPVADSNVKREKSARSVWMSRLAAAGRGKRTAWMPLGKRPAAGRPLMLENSPNF
jgi:hypothetical protein